ncbi:pectinesterase inhibitor-like [Punica granatum]|uniref:Uncharacterized protein n=2 Tax=Punica granatum TaxID=22663 RepID=A0A2I0K268_PUNGR|nr:pectinesterase inhibitor-like [Punica granatum]PKI62651.1 hypothetical protein CRG98_016922 [Punica granatum]
MKNNMNTPVLLLLALGTIPALGCANDINQLCSKTPFPGVCLSTLQANPKSNGATIKQLGLIVVAKVENTVKVAEKKIETVVVSREAFIKGDYIFAELYMTDALNALGECEDGSRPGSHR